MKNGVSATAVSFQCGCAISFELQLQDSAVSILRSTSNGCGYMVAAGRVLCSLLVGKPLADLDGLSDAELGRRIRDVLNDIPADRQQCLDAAIDALHAVFEMYRTRRVQEFVGEQALFCTCFGVTEDTIEQVLSTSDVSSVDEIGDICRAGTGCGACRMLIQELLDMRKIA